MSRKILLAVLSVVALVALSPSASAACVGGNEITVGSDGGPYVCPNTFGICPGEISPGGEVTLGTPRVCLP